MTSRRYLAGFLTLAALLAARVDSLRAQQQPSIDVTVDSLVVQGNDRVSADEIRSISQLRVGEEVDYLKIQDAIRRLFATGQFADVQVWVTPRPPSIFHIEVVERPLITSIQFEGSDHVNGGQVQDTVGLSAGGPLNPEKIAAAAAMTRKMLSRSGFPRARVDTSMVRDPTEVNGYRLVFQIHEGPRLAVAQIDFEGNHAFSDGELRGAMGTGTEGFFWFHSGEFETRSYHEDLADRLPDFYAKHGYIDFSVVDDTVVVDTTTGKGRIRIKVSEGQQYRLADFHITGNRRFPSEQLENYYDQASEVTDTTREAGPPVFDAVAFRKATGDISDLYRNAGYLRAYVVPQVQRVPADSTGGQPEVRASWNVHEGDPAYIRHVTIIGNDYTHERIIRSKLLVFPGDVYSQERVIQSLKNVQATGFFAQIPPSEAVQIKPRDDGDVDLVFKVKEKQTGNINFGMSASASTGLAGFIGYDQPNLFGQAKSGHFRWLFGGRSTDIELSYSDPQVFGSRRSATISLLDARDRYQTFSLANHRQVGGSIEVGTPFLNLRSTRFYVGYSLFRDEVNDINAFGVTPQQRQLITTGTRSTVSLRLVRDTRDSDLFPTQGSRNAFSARFTGGPLGGDGRYAKYELESSWFVPVAQIGGGLKSNPIEFVGGISASSGLILGDNPFFLERFFMGGTQTGIQLRGYGEATVTPQGHIPRSAPFSSLDRVGEAYFQSSVQFGVKVTGSLYPSVFMDAGNVWAHAGEFNPTDLLVGAGVGVSLVTPFGPIGIDYAYGFDRRDVLGRPDPGWKLHFKFGRVF